MEEDEDYLRYCCNLDDDEYAELWMYGEPDIKYHWWNYLHDEIDYQLWKLKRLIRFKYLKIKRKHKQHKTYGI